jgi:hypothetical protein
VGKGDFHLRGKAYILLALEEPRLIMRIEYVMPRPMIIDRRINLSDVRERLGSVRVDKTLAIIATEKLADLFKVRQLGRGIAPLVGHPL